MAETTENRIPEDSVELSDPRQKAAVLVISLGADRASQIYKYLSEQEIEDLTYEVAKLGKTTNQQVERTLDEFYKMCLTHKMMMDGGLDYARRRHSENLPQETCWKRFQKRCSPSLSISS